MNQKNSIKIINYITLDSIKIINHMTLIINTIK